MILKIGSRGTAVKEYQQKLCGFGYSIDVDGIFGPQTRSVTKQYQKDNGLSVDGIAGPQTLGSVYRASDENAPGTGVKYIVAAGGLNLRKSASILAPLLREVKQGEIGRYLGRSSGIYRHIRMEDDGLEGYGWSERLIPYDQEIQPPQSVCVPQTEHFTMKEWETRCKIADKSLYPVLQTLMNALEVMRERSGGRGISVHSGYRTKQYHQSISPGTNSMHCYAGAADISFGGDTSRKGMHEIGVLAKQLYDEGIFGGLGLGNSCVHVDVRGRTDVNGNLIKYDNLRAMWFYNGYKNYNAWQNGTK